MDGNYSIGKRFSCRPEGTGNSIVVIVFLALPFHCLMMKVLSINLRFENPRHMILFCLSVSDCFQLVVGSMVSIIMDIGDYEIGTKACDAFRSVLIFTVALGHIVSSLSIVTLSIERYIACFHSYRIHELLTNKRIASTLISFWVCGLTGAGISVIPGERGSERAILSNSIYLERIFVAVALPVSLILNIVQSMLFYLGRKKLARVEPTGLQRSQDEVERIRKRQMKILIVAAVVVLSYLISTLPVTCLIILNRFAKVTKMTFSSQMVATSLGMLNTLLNPFIYGIGMVDTRHAIKRELIRFKNFMLVKAGVRDELEV